MTPLAADQSARRFLRDRVTVIRNVTGQSVAAYTAKNVHARVEAYRPHDLAGDLTQMDEYAIILASDLVQQEFPLPMIKGDVVMVQGRTTKVQDVDQSTRKVDQTIIAYVCRIRGS